MSSALESQHSGVSARSADKKGNGPRDVPTGEAGSGKLSFKAEGNCTGMQVCAASVKEASPAINRDPWTAYLDGITLGGAGIFRRFEACILEAAGYSVSDAGRTWNLFVALIIVRGLQWEGQ